MRAKPKHNFRLLRRVIKHIKEEPKRLNMDILSHHVEAFDPDFPPCGTQGCIAGWACMLTGTKPRMYDNFMWGKGRKLLGLTSEEAKRLFNVPAEAVSIHETEVDDPDCYYNWESEEDKEAEAKLYWPYKFAKRYENATTARGKVNATVARIEHFIKTKGKE